MQLDIGEGGTGFDVTSKQGAWIDIGGNLTTNTHFYGIRHNTNLVVQNGSDGKSLSGVSNTIYWNHATLFGTVSGITNDVFIGTCGSGQSGDVIGMRSDVQVTDADVDCQNIYGLKTFLNLDDGNTSTNVYGEYTEIDIEANHEAQGNVYGSYIKVVDDDASAGDAYGLYIDSGAGVDSAIYATGTHASGYSAQFYNDGDNSNRFGIKVQCGTDSLSSAGDAVYMSFFDGDGGASGGIRNSSNTDLPEFYEGSDKRIKDNIADTKVDALESINSLKLREFTKKKQSQKTKIGLVAQEVLNSKIPELVGTASNETYKEFFDEDEDKMYTIGTGNMVYYLMKAVQELSAKVTELESKL